MSQILQIDVHPDAQSLYAFAEHLLPSSEHEAVLDHLTSCDRCRQILHVAQDAASDSALDANSTAPIFRPSVRAADWCKSWRFAWSVGVALLATIILTIILHSRSSAPTTHFAQRSSARESRSTGSPPTSTSKGQATQSSSARDAEDLPASTSEMAEPRAGVANIPTQAVTPSGAAIKSPPLLAPAESAPPSQSVAEERAGVQGSTAAASALITATKPRDENTDIPFQQAIEALYPISKPTADHKDLVAAGAVIDLLKGNLQMNAVNAPVECKDIYRNGNFESSSGCAGSKLKFFGVMGLARNASNSRTFVAGEKIWLTKVTIEDKAAVLEFLSDPINEVRYRALVTYPFPSDGTSTPDAVLAAIKESLKPEPIGGSSDAMVAAHPAGTMTAAAASAKVAAAPPLWASPTTMTTAHAGTTTAANAVAAARPATAKPGGAPGGVSSAVASARGGLMAHAAPMGARDRMSPSGNALRIRANGRPADLHDARRGMDIHHYLGGGRSAMMKRPDGSRLYYESGQPGYIGHPYVFHGHEFERRSYYDNGRAYDLFYSRYYYRGLPLDVYAPARYYASAFYAWIYNPWSSPVAYPWGFATAAWYGYYSGYFAPYPVYASSSQWLTDYLLSQSLQAGYAAHVAAAAVDIVAASGAPPAPVTQDIKQMIADEVKRQVALENVEAQANVQEQLADAGRSGIVRTLGDGQPHVFVAGKQMDLVVDATGQECAITDGDVLLLRNSPPAESTSATLTVLSSKGGVECKRNVLVAVSFEDLQEMQNHLRETIDHGMQELQVKQGKGGIPSAPASALIPPVTALLAQGAPPPDPAGAQQLAQQAKETDSVEKEVLAETSGSATPTPGVPVAPAGPRQTLTVSIGQSASEVTAAMGQPSKMVNIGPKTVYFYLDLKVTFVNGKVTSVE